MNSPTQDSSSFENTDSPRGTSPITVPVADTSPEVHAAPLNSPLAPRIMASPGGSHSKRYRSSAGDEHEIVAFSPPAHRSRLEAKGSPLTTRRQRDYQRSGGGSFESSGQIAAARSTRGVVSRYPLSEVNSQGGEYVDNSSEDSRDNDEDVGAVDFGLALPNSRGCNRGNTTRNASSRSRGSDSGSSSGGSSGSSSSSNSSSPMNAPPSSAVLAQYIRRFRTADPAPAHERRALVSRDAFWWNSGSAAGPSSSNQAGSFDGSGGGSATQDGASPVALPAPAGVSSRSNTPKSSSSLASLRARMQRGGGTSSKSAKEAQQAPQRQRDNYYDGASDDDDDENEEDDRYQDDVAEEADFFVSDHRDSDHDSAESFSTRSGQASSSVASSLNSLTGALPSSGGFLEGFADGGDRGLKLSDAASISDGHAMTEAGGRSSVLSEGELRTPDDSRTPEDHPVRGSMELDLRASMLLKHCDTLLGAQSPQSGATKPAAATPSPQMHALSFGARSSSAGLVDGAGTFSPLTWGAGLPTAWASQNASFGAAGGAYPEFAALAGPVTGHVENVRHGVSQISLEEINETSRLMASSMHEDDPSPSNEALQPLISSSSISHDAGVSTDSGLSSERDASTIQKALSGHETTVLDHSSTSTEDTSAEVPSPPDSPVSDSPPLVRPRALPLFSALPQQGQLDVGGELPWAMAAAAANSSYPAPADINSDAELPSSFGDDLAVDEVEARACVEAIAGLAQLSLGRFLRCGANIGTLPMFAVHLSPDANNKPLDLKASSEHNESGNCVGADLTSFKALDGVEKGFMEATEVASISPSLDPETAEIKRGCTLNDLPSVGTSSSLECQPEAPETPTRSMSCSEQDNSSNSSLNEAAGGGDGCGSEIASKDEAEGSVSLALASFSVTSPAASPEDERFTKATSVHATAGNSRLCHGDSHDAAAAAAATAIALAKVGLEMGSNEVHSPPTTTRPREGDDDDDEGASHNRHSDGSRSSTDDDSLRPSPPKNRRQTDTSMKSDGPGLDGSDGGSVAGSPDRGTLAGDGFLVGGLMNLSPGQINKSNRFGSVSNSSASTFDSPKSNNNGGTSDNLSGLGFDSGRFGEAMSLRDDCGSATRNESADGDDADPELAVLRIRELALEKELKRRKARKS